MRTRVDSSGRPFSYLIYDTLRRRRYLRKSILRCMRSTRTHMQRTLDTIFRAAIAAVEPRGAVAGCMRLAAGRLDVDTHDGAVRHYALDRYEHIRVVGCGKAGAAMARAAIDVLDSRIDEGIVSTKYGHGVGAGLGPITLVEAGHPHPDRNGLDAAAGAVAMLERSGADDLVVALISGGGSALWPLPVAGITLEEKLAATDALLGCGADIVEVNCVRKHLSAIKGGQAARAASPADVIVLVISDVVGDRLDAIASGPFHPDPTTFGQALGVVRRYGIERELPPAVLARLEHGAAQGIAETPTQGEGCFSTIAHAICAGNARALDAAAARARGVGYETQVLSAELQGDVAEAADYLMQHVRKAVDSSAGRPLCLLSGGETTVRLSTDHGTGGRNQQLALEMALRLDGLEGVAALCCGTDGTDGPTDAAGGMVDGHTVCTAVERGLDIREALRRNDAYPLLDALGMLVRTGPTGTNVMDVQVVLVNG